MITIYDHNTHPIWAEHYKKNFLALGITNGAYTYSIDIVKYHLPIIIEILKQQNKYKNILISTVTMVNEDIIPLDTDLIIEYVHESVERDLPKILKNQWLGIKFIYITTRVDIFETLSVRDISCILIPMAIDTSLFTKYAKSEKYDDKRVIYFGNKYLGKGRHYKNTKTAFIYKGWKFDSICYNVFNDEIKLNREQVLDTVSKYRYGIGEGRCVLEMNAMGLKTLICAGGNQGLMMNDNDFNIQKQHNFSDGKIFTFSDNLNECIESFDKAVIKTLDVHGVLPDLKKQLEEILL